VRHAAWAAVPERSSNDLSAGVGFEGLTRPCCEIEPVWCKYGLRPIVGRTKQVMSTKNRGKSAVLGLP